MLKYVHLIATCNQNEGGSFLRKTTMGKKRISTLGSESEEQQKAKRAVQLEQKKLREGQSSGKTGKTAKAPGLKGGQRVIDTTAESLAEYEIVQSKLNAAAPEADSPETQKSPSPSARTKIRIRSNSYKQAKLLVKPDQFYPFPEALELLKKVSLTKFDPTVELHIILKSGSVNQNVELPFTTGKTKRIAIADDTVIAKIESGKIDFDVLLASPAQMGKLVKLAKILGPKGLMPNPKTGTVVADPEATAKKMSGTVSVTLRTEKSAPVLHTFIGKLSQPEKELSANLSAIIAALPAAGIAKIVLKSTMSPAIKLRI